MHSPSSLEGGRRWDPVTESHVSKPGALLSARPDQHFDDKGAETVKTRASVFLLRPAVFEPVYSRVIIVEMACRNLERSIQGEGHGERSHVMSPRGNSRLSEVGCGLLPTAEAITSWYETPIHFLIHLFNISNFEHL